MRHLVDGGVYKHRAAHFEWLLDVAEPLGLEFGDLGKRRVGSADTVHFCDELARLYANEDDTTSIAASFAIENWAAAGFWDELIAGFKVINEDRAARGLRKIPSSFWTFHSALEQQHAEDERVRVVVVRRRHGGRRVRAHVLEDGGHLY